MFFVLTLTFQLLCLIFWFCKSALINIFCQVSIRNTVFANIVSVQIYQELFVLVFDETVDWYYYWYTNILTENKSIEISITSPIVKRGQKIPDLLDSHWKNNDKQFEKLRQCNCYEDILEHQFVLPHPIYPYLIRINLLIFLMFITQQRRNIGVESIQM